MMALFMRFKNGELEFGWPAVSHLEVKGVLCWIYLLIVGFFTDMGCILFFRDFDDLLEKSKIYELCYVDGNFTQSLKDV